MSSTDDLDKQVAEKLTISNGDASNDADVDAVVDADTRTGPISTDFNLDNMRQYFVSWWEEKSETFK